MFMRTQINEQALNNNDSLHTASAFSIAIQLYRDPLITKPILKEHVITFQILLFKLQYLQCLRSVAGLEFCGLYAMYCALQS